ncbi:MAG: hypothetical protein K2K54_12485 [Lachnospiraceae bacterium]|nr:hypothetical protein [Lachnospiraceae bacterium]
MYYRLYGGYGVVCFFGALCCGVDEMAEPKGESCVKSPAYKQVMAN